MQQLASLRRFAQQAAKTAREQAAALGTPLRHEDVRDEDVRDEDVRDAAWEAFRRGSTGHGDDTAAGGLGPDTDWAHRYGAAFVELLEHLPTDRLSTVVVTIDHDRLYAWSELHHQDPWATGGTTDLRFAVPLCGHHHRRIHDNGFDHRIDTDQHGIKTVTYRRRT